MQTLRPEVFSLKEYWRNGAWDCWAIVYLHCTRIGLLINNYWSSIVTKLHAQSKHIFGPGADRILLLSLLLLLFLLERPLEEKCQSKAPLGLPDIPYFTGAPVFEPQSPASRNEATREMKSPVFQLGPVSHQSPHTYPVILAAISGWTDSQH